MGRTNIVFILRVNNLRTAKRCIKKLLKWIYKNSDERMAWGEIKSIQKFYKNTVDDFFASQERILLRYIRKSVKYGKMILERKSLDSKDYDDLNENPLHFFFDAVNECDPYSPSFSNKVYYCVKRRFKKDPKTNIKITKYSIGCVIKKQYYDWILEENPEFMSIVSIHY